MTRNLPAITAKRFLTLLKKNDISVVAAWLIQNNGAGSMAEEELIEIALVLDKFTDTPENRSQFLALRDKVDERIRLHLYDQHGMDAGGEEIVRIRSNGITLT